MPPSFQPSVTVPVLYNGTTFLNGRLVAVEACSIVVGVVKKQNGYYISDGRNTPLMVDALHIISPSFNDLFLNLTMTAYRDLIAQADTDTNVTMEFEHTFGSPTTSFQNDTLANSVLLQVVGDGVIFSLDDVTYNTDGTVILPSATSFVQILYRKI